MPLPFPKKRIPTKIEPCPIADASVEVRFETSIPAGAIFGILYKEFQSEYPDVKMLPIQQIPEDIRNTNDEFKYQPHYQIKNENYVLQIGPRVMTIGAINNYPGWDKYKSEIVSSLIEIKELGIADKITRLGLRYVNFFENLDVFEKLDGEVFSKNALLIDRNSYVRTEFFDNDLIHILQFGNSGVLSKNNQLLNGSMIDIDVSKSIHLDDFFNNIEEQVSVLHDVEKEIFFGLLSKEFLSNFKPTYD